jgi:hypothetical protein
LPARSCVRLHSASIEGMKRQDRDSLSGRASAPAAEIFAMVAPCEAIRASSARTFLACSATEQEQSWNFAMACARGVDGRRGRTCHGSTRDSLIRSAEFFTNAMFHIETSRGLIVSQSPVSDAQIGASTSPMPSGVVVQASDCPTEAAQAAEVCSPSNLPKAKLFDGPDPSIHMLGLPKSYPQLGRWVTLAILAGGAAAFGLMAFFAR